VTGLALQTEFPFTLPKGYVDRDGTLHRDGVMRLATARDEIEPLRDVRVRDNEAYLTIIVLTRVITRLGSLPSVDTGVIDNLFAADLLYLQDLYGVINFGSPREISAFLEGESGPFDPAAGASGA